MTLTLQIVLAIAGCIALLVGLFGGGVKAKEVEVPKISALARIFSSLVGIILIGVAIQLPDLSRQEAQPTSTPNSSTQPVPDQIAINPMLPTKIDTPDQTSNPIPSQVPSTLTNTLTNTPINTPTNTATSSPTNTPIPKANGGIFALSRIPNSMEVWWVGANGSVQGAFWYEGSEWQEYELAPAGSASTKGGITAVSRIPDSMEVWWIGVDGSVQDAFWYEGGAWGQFELAPAGSTSMSGGIASVSRIPNSMEIWWARTGGSIRDAFWYEGENWQQFNLQP
jgi:hypothetical protein